MLRCPCRLPTRHSFIPTSFSISTSRTDAAALCCYGVALRIWVLRALVCRRAQLAQWIDFAGIFLERFLIHVDPQAGRGRQIDVAVFRFELIRRDLIAEIDERQE